MSVCPCVARSPHRSEVVGREVASLLFCLQMHRLIRADTRANAQVWGFCCAYWHANWPAIGMLGPMASVDRGLGGAVGSHQLCSSRKPSGGISGHGMPAEYKGYADVWTLMLTGKPPPAAANTTERPAQAVGQCACPETGIVSGHNEFAQ